MANLYIILEVTRTASQEEIKASYRKLAKRYHPDTSKKQCAKSREQFQQVTDAYEILSNPQKRSLYDQGHIDHKGQTIKNPFKDFHPKKPPSKPQQDIQKTLAYSIKLNFQESLTGVEKTLTLGGKKVTVTIPKGTDHKSTLKFPIDKTQTLALTVYVSPHPHLRREGPHMHLDLPLTLGEALSGGKVEVPTLKGPVLLKIPPSVQSGTILTMNGLGVPGNKPGNQYVKIIISPPDGDTNSLKNLIKSWEKSNPYNPRNF